MNDIRKPPEKPGLGPRPGQKVSTKLTRKREAAIVALLRHGTIVEAAKAAGVNERTLRVWLRDPTFADAYAQARGEVLTRAVGMLQETTVEAVRALRRNLTRTPPNVQVMAARALLDLSFRASELLELRERVAALETMVCAHVGMADEAEEVDEDEVPH